MWQRFLYYILLHRPLRPLIINTLKIYFVVQIICFIFARYYIQFKMAYLDEDKLRIITDICDDVIERKISFNEAVSNSEISLISFYQWISKDKELQSLYNYAREVRSDILFEEIIEISDNQELGEEETIEYDETGKIVSTKLKKGDLLRQRQLKIDARKWVVAKMQPKKYGDKLDLQNNGGAFEPSTTAIVFKNFENE